MTDCSCPEGFVSVYRDGQVVGRRRVAARHDCDYVRQRNALIPEATRLANQQVSPGLAWSTAFSAAIDKLVRERIYRVG